MQPDIRRAVIEARRANPALPILAAYWAARRTKHFRETLAAANKAFKKRSQAAKAAWKARKAKAQLEARGY